MKAGRARVHFEGTLDHHRMLPLGRYTVTIRAADAAGNTSTPSRATFVLVR